MACVKNFNSSQNKWRMDLLFPYLSVVGFGFGFCWAYLCGVRVPLTVPFLSGYFSLWHSDFNCISFIFSFLNWKALLLPKHTLLNHHYSAVNCFPPFSVLFTLFTNTDSRIVHFVWWCWWCWLSFWLCDIFSPRTLYRNNKWKRIPNEKQKLPNERKDQIKSRKKDVRATINFMLRNPYFAYCVTQWCAMQCVLCYMLCCMCQLYVKIYI